MSFDDSTNELDLMNNEHQALSDEADLSSGQVLAYLQTHPDFFHENAAELSEMPLSSVQGNIISMASWQARVLREKADLSELRLSYLLTQAANNQKIHDKLFNLVIRWLSQDDAQALLLKIEKDLKKLFHLDEVKLMVWRDSAREVLYPITSTWSDSLVNYTKSLYKPYCGLTQGLEAESLFVVDISSQAIIPLWHAHEHDCVGVLLLGSKDSERFTADMGTHFLHSMALMVGAALSRVTERVMPPHLTLKNDG